MATTSDPERWPYDDEQVAGYVNSSAAATDVLAEAMRQHDRLGWSPEHDDEHDAPAWAHLLLLRVVRLSTPTTWGTAPDAALQREYLAEVAAMAIRAMESLDRTAVE